MFQLGCKSQSVENVTTVKRDAVSKDQSDFDTVFLQKRAYSEAKSEHFQYVYESRDSLVYSRLIPKIKYENFSLTNNPYRPVAPITKVEKVDLLDIPIKWTEVVYYNDNYYVTCPSDFCGLQQVIVSDSCLIEKTCEGPYPRQIRSINKVNLNQYTIQVGNLDSNFSEYQITIIDSVSGIAVWRVNNKYRLLADVTRFRNLPLAVADCKGKCPIEIKSEAVDYLQLIKDALN